MPRELICPVGQILALLAAEDAYAQVMGGRVGYETLDIVSDVVRSRVVIFQEDDVEFLLLRKIAAMNPVQYGLGGSLRAQAVTTVIQCHGITLSDRGASLWLR